MRKAVRTLAARLEAWFAGARREMPWRTRPEPYFCWLSEIMMQQTTFEQALPYYTRFLARFPDVASLAAAREADVLKQWEGLGYYARARNLHKAARAICAGGEPAWPHDLEGWRAVPGVGPYTAAALASVLDGVREPVVDGNVARVFARYWLLPDDFRKLPPRASLADRLRDEIAAAAVPGDFNQAMMELGALVCTPARPACAACPLRADCAARRTGAQSDYPVRAPRKELPVRRVTALVVTDGKGRVLLVQNREGGLLKGLWELPTTEPAAAHVQTFSHFRQEIAALRAVRDGAVFEDPGRVPLTTAARRVLEKCGVLAPSARGTISKKKERS